MADDEYRRLQEALQKAPTEAARKAAADAMRKYLESGEARRKSLQAKRKGSKPALVTLGLGKPYPTAVKLEDIPDQIEKNPEMFELMKKIVSVEDD